MSSHENALVWSVSRLVHSTYTLARARALTSMSATSEANVALQIYPHPRLDNSRILWLPEEAAAETLVQLYVGAEAAFTGKARHALTAEGGDVLLICLPRRIGLAAFAVLPELEVLPVPAHTNYVVNAKIVKVFGGVQSKSFPALKGLMCNPQVLTADYGKKIIEFPPCHRSVQHPYTPQALLHIMTGLWTGTIPSQPFDRTRATYLLDGSCVPGLQEPCHQQQPGKTSRKRKPSNQETKSLNRELLLKELLALGIPSEHARHIMDVESSGWGVNLLVGSNDVLDLTLEVFRPHSVMPVITAPFEKVYKQVAILWKQEFDTPKPTSAPQSSRYTRQQERAAAAMEERLQSEGLSDIQMQQVKSVVADTVNVLAQQQQQTHSEVQSMKSEHTSIAAALKAQGKCLEESVKVLQRLAPALQYNTAAPAQVTYPSQLYATGNMPAAPQQEARQPGQSHAPNGAAFAAQSAF